MIMRRGLGRKERAAILARRRMVGEFVRRRRRELNLSRTDMMRFLGYKSIMSLADVELGRVGVPFKRIYQYADFLRLPRDEFVRFVIGGIQGRAGGGFHRPGIKAPRERTMTAAEQKLIDEFRRLPGTYRQRVRQQIREYLVPRTRRTRVQGLKRRAPTSRKRGAVGRGKAVRRRR